MTSLSIAEVLERAADLIEPEGAWAQRANAYDAAGNRVPANSPEATCFCMAGALIRSSGGGYPKRLVAAVLPKVEGGRDPLVAFNDAPERTQAEDVAKLREASALAREQGL